MTPLTYSELLDSQAPALALLRKLGWRYLQPVEAERERNGIRSGVLLEGILAERLAAINRFEYKGQQYPFSRGTIAQAISALKSVPEQHVVLTNEKVYDLLTLGKSFTETVQGDQKAYTLRYIDWANPQNNHYHVTDEFVVEGIRETRRPDLVLFVNGIPFAVLENKRRDKNLSIAEAISQHLRNQRKDEGAPRLFHYSQLLLAVQPNEVRYATTGTEARFWGTWKEDTEAAVTRLLKSTKHNTPAEDRLPTEQDRVLFALLRPERLMELAYIYSVFDGPERKVARYQQYFAVRETLSRVRTLDAQGTRKGGVIWHTQGSGKSLTMVMLSKALALEKGIARPRVVIVTDRVDLDRQIWKTFLNCGKNVQKAGSGNQLVELLKDSAVEVITSVIDKFETGTRKVGFSDPSPDLFVLVDESHRSQYGLSHQQMKRMLPNACYIGFTGTPLMKNEKSTARKFGGFIHTYTIDQAVKDEAVVPLLYEGRAAKLSVNKQAIDKGFERLSAPLGEEAQKDLKKKFSRISKLYQGQQVVEEIAHDISKHFCGSWQGTPFKAQLAAPSIDTAIRYYKYFQSQPDPELRLNAAVVFTPPDTREGNEDVWEEANDEARTFWKQLMEKHGNDPARYEERMIEKFKAPSSDVEVMIVVSKLLTGFDSPRNTVLYLARPLKEHNLLQAIARVNRLFDGKQFGYIIDYVGLLGDLDEALTSYSALDGFEENDVANAVNDMRTEARKVPQRHAEVWDLFKGVDRNDTEALERHLAAKDVRDDFYGRVTAYARSLHTALGSDDFYKEFDNEQVTFYLKELKRFEGMRRSVQQRYAEVVNYKEYEPRVRKLLDMHVQADRVDHLTGEVNIMDKSMVSEALEHYGKTPASKADFIAHQMKKSISENLDRDEAFYRKFSDLIEDTIKAFHEGRINEKEYLERILGTRNDLEKGHLEGIPEELREAPQARAFFGALNSVLERQHTTGLHRSRLAQAGLDIAAIVERHIIRDWHRNIDVQKRIEDAIEDYLLLHRKDLGVELTFDEIDAILEKCLKSAKHNF